MDIIDLLTIPDERGCLTCIEGEVHIPFSIGRVFWIYDVTEGATRGGHAHKECHEFLVAVAGSLEVVLDDGDRQMTFTLDRCHRGLHIAPGVWATEQNFSPGAVCLAIPSHRYDEEDYIRDYSEFLKSKR